MVEDESGRVKLVGEPIKRAQLVTGVIIGALGAENAAGDFEVVDICYPGMPPQASTLLDSDMESEAMDVDRECSISISTLPLQTTY
jgi:DNA polymerase delta subunit 2